MRPDTRALLGKELHEQLPMALFWLAFMLLPVIASTAVFLGGAALGRAGSTWAEFLAQVGYWAPEDLRGLLVPAGVFAWGGFRAFHRESEAGTHAWLRTMPVPDEVVAWTKSAAAAGYVAVVTSLLLAAQLGAVAFSGLDGVPRGTISGIVQTWLATTAAFVCAFVVGAYIGISWKPRPLGRAALLFIGSWAALLITVGILEMRRSALLLERVPDELLDWVNRPRWMYGGIMLTIFAVWGVYLVAVTYGRRSAVRQRA